jgi:hypothetical protein
MLQGEPAGALTVGVGEGIGVDRLLHIYPSLQAALANDVPERTPEIPGLPG